MDDVVSYSPHFTNCQRVNAHCELFPEVDSQFDFTLEDLRDRPASIWSLKKIGLLQSRFEKTKLLTRNIPLHEMLTICNDVFGFNGWRTEVIKTELDQYEEVMDETGEDQEIDDEGPESIQYDDDGLVIIAGKVTRIRYTMVVSTTIRVILQDGTYHDAIGVGKAYNMLIKLMLFIKCKKESMTNGIKNSILELREVLVEYELKRNSGYYV